MERQETHELIAYMKENLKIELSQEDYNGNGATTVVAKLKLNGVTISDDSTTIWFPLNSNGDPE